MNTDSLVVDLRTLDFLPRGVKVIHVNALSAFLLSEAQTTVHRDSVLNQLKVNLQHVSKLQGQTGQRL